MLTTIFAVCALRTNIILFSALFTLIFAFGSGAGALWNFAEGNVESGEKLFVVSASSRARSLEMSNLLISNQ